jgi:hypothetical protein
MSYNLFLDDIRKPIDLKQAWHKGQWEDYPSLFAWEIVRSYAEFVDYILKNGWPKRVSFDHDLAWDHYPQDDLAMTQPINYEKFTEKTGYDAAKWLCDYCLTNNFDLPDCYVHSFNPVGRMNIANYLVRFQEHLDSQKKQP